MPILFCIFGLSDTRLRATWLFVAQFTTKDTKAYRDSPLVEAVIWAIRRGGPQWAGYAGLDGPGQSWRTIRRSP